MVRDDAPSRILVVRAGALGDTLMATPVVSAFRERYPGAEIDFLCAAPAVPLLDHNDKLSRVFSLRYRNLPYLLSPEKRRLAGQLRARRHELAVVLERAPSYRQIVQAAGVPTIRSFLETPFDPKLHSIVNNLRAAGLESWASSPPDMELSVESAQRDAAEAVMTRLPRPVVGMHAGYGPKGKKKGQSERLKGWALENFVELGKRLLGSGASLVLTGSKQDALDVAKCVDMLPSGNVISVAGKTSVSELAAVIGRLDVFVSVDSGPAHMAAALGTPLVVLWGPAILEQVRPISSKAPVEVLRHPPACAPCYDTPLMRSCRQNVCMEAITPEEVFATTHRLLSSRA